MAGCDQTAGCEFQVGLAQSSNIGISDSAFP
jgi:hypothetical protein